MIDKELFIRVLKKLPDCPCEMCIHYIKCPCEKALAVPFYECEGYEFGEYEPCYAGRPCGTCLASDDLDGFTLVPDDEIEEKLNKMLSHYYI